MSIFCLGKKGGAVNLATDAQIPIMRDEIAALRKEVKELSKSVEKLESHAFPRLFNSLPFEERFARNRDLTELDERMYQLSKALGMAYEPAHKVEGRFVKKGQR